MLVIIILVNTLLKVKKNRIIDLVQYLLKNTKYVNIIAK